MSNLSFMAKLIEKAAQIQLMAHFTEQNLLPKHQNAYRKHFSTETAILNICDNIWTNMENSKLTSIICLDLSVAFDTVNHSILLDVMRNYFGITDMALDGIQHYLRNRKFSVHIDSFSSNTKTINFSVPQGSILGPPLFNCYVSTLMEIIPENDENFGSGYADDHALINTFHPEDTDISCKLASNISYIKEWMNGNQLKMNDAKTEFIVFGSKHQVQRNDLKSLNIDDTTIKAKSGIKFLGAYLDESLSMKTHIANRTKNAFYNLHLIKHIRKYITQETAKMLLCSLVLSQLDYLNSILTDLPKAILRPYNYTQRYAARLACNKTKRDSAQDCMKILHWLLIEFRAKFKLLTIVFKTLQGNGPSYLQSKLNTMTYHRTTRKLTTRDITLKVPFNKKKTQGDCGFSHTAAIHWNKLPDYIRQTEDISIFRRLLKTHYFRLAYKT